MADGVNVNSKSVNDIYQMDFDDKKTFDVKDQNQVNSIYTALCEESSQLSVNPDVDGNDEVNQEDFDKGNFTTCIKTLQNFAAKLRSFASGITKKKLEEVKNKYLNYAFMLESRAKELGNIMKIASDRTKPSRFNYSTEEKTYVDKYNQQVSDLETSTSELLDKPNASLEELNAKQKTILDLRKELVEQKRTEFTKFDAYCHNMILKLDNIARGQLEPRINELNKQQSASGDNNLASAEPDTTDSQIAGDTYATQAYIEGWIQRKFGAVPDVDKYRGPDGDAAYEADMEYAMKHKDDAKIEAMKTAHEEVRKEEDRIHKAQVAIAKGEEPK